MHTGAGPPSSSVVESWLDDPFPDYDAEPVLFGKRRTNPPCEGWGRGDTEGLPWRNLAKTAGGVDYTAIYQSTRRLEQRAKINAEMKTMMNRYIEIMSKMYDV